VCLLLGAREVVLGPAVTTSRRKLMNSVSICFSVTTCAVVHQRQHDDAEGGLHLSVLIKLIDDDIRISPRPSSSTIRMPSRLDSSRRSEIPSILLSRISSPIFSISVALLT